MAKPKPGPQAGILTRPQGHFLLAAFTFSGDRTPAFSRAALEALRAVIQKELSSDLDAQDAATPKDAPGPETGELGFEGGYNRYFLTITLGLSAAGFDALGVAPDQWPADLVPIPWAQLGDAPPPATDGDVILQVCSDNVYVNEHVVRRVEEEVGGQLALAWTQAGVQRHTSRAARTSRREGRALIGFHDGTSNLSPRHSDDDADLVFVNPKVVGSYPQLPPIQNDQYSGPNFPADLRGAPTSEPAWTEGGTYMVVRTSLTDITAWDALPLGEQEATVGRFKFSGASLDLDDDPRRIEHEPAYAANQADLRVGPDAHARKTGPRRSDTDDADRRIYRRGYPLIEVGPGGLRRGLVFVCFGRTISTQFEFVVRAWMNNPNFPVPGAGVDRLRRFDQQVLSGGYYFVPPLAHRSVPWSWVVPEAS